jgi:hypothetical protein
MWQRAPTLKCDPPPSGGAFEPRPRLNRRRTAPSHLRDEPSAERASVPERNVARILKCKAASVAFPSHGLTTRRMA